MSIANSVSDTTRDPTCRVPTRASGGNEVVTITGDNFGPIVSGANAFGNVGNIGEVTYQNTALSGLAGTRLAGTVFTAQNCKVRTAHTRIVCTTTEGVGHGHGWLLEISGVQSAQTGGAKDSAQVIRIRHLTPFPRFLV